MKKFLSILLSIVIISSFAFFAVASGDSESDTEETQASDESITASADADEGASATNKSTTTQETTTAKESTTKSTSKSTTTTAKPTTTKVTTTKRTTTKSPVQTTADNQGYMVWIPTNGGKKYHSHSGCSNMDNPKQVTEQEAISQGFTPCKRCY